MKKRFMKFIYTIAVITTVVLSFPINVIASTLSDNYSNGDIRYNENSVGDVSEKGGVKLTKTVSKIDNTDDEFLVNLELKGKNTETTQSTEATPYIMFVVDRSGTMEVPMCKDERYGSCYDYNEYTRFDLAKEGAINASKSIHEKYNNAQIGLITFGESPDVLLERGFSNSPLINKNFSEGVYGYTPTDEALEKAKIELLKKKSNASSLHVILLSDGAPEDHTGTEKPTKRALAKAEELKENGIEIFSIAFGFGYSEDESKETLTKIASSPSNTHYFDAANYDNLTKSFSTIVNNIKVPALAGTKAIITDTISDGFTYVSGSANPSSATVSGNVIKFNVGDITENGTRVSFRIKANKNNMPKTSDNWHPTNDIANNGVNVNYDDASGKNTTKSILKSTEVYYKSKLNYTINYYKDSTYNNPFDTVLGSASKGDIINVSFDNIPKGYTNNSSNVTSFEVDEDNMIINIIYNKKKLSYIVEYYEDETKISNDSDNTFDENVYFGDKIGEELINKNKYKNFGYQNGVIKTDMPYEIKEENNIIKVCYERRHDMSYTVRYVDYDTRENLYENKIVSDRTYNKTYEEEAKEAPNGYKLVSDKKQTITLDSDNKVLTFYYEKRNDMSYIVRYVELVGNDEVEILDSKIVTNKTYNETYEEEAKIAPNGYKLVSDKKQTITLDSDNKVLTFYYEKRNDMSYTVRYIDCDTNESIISDKVVKNKTYNEEIEEFAEYPYGYNLVSENVQKFKLDSDGKVITFYYNKIKAKYVVRYLEEETNLEILPSIKKEGNLIDKVTEEAKNIKGYDLVSDDKVTIELNKEEVSEIIFYYKKKDINYTVKYLDNETKSEIAPSVKKEGKYLDEVTEKSINISGYKLVSFNEVKIKLDEENKTIVFYYEKEKVEVKEVVKTGVNDDNNYLLLTLLFSTVTSLGYVLKKRFN